MTTNATPYEPLPSPSFIFKDLFGKQSHPHSKHCLPAPSPNSARTGYTTEEALFISAQLSTDVVSVLQKVWVLAILSKQHGGTQART